MTCLLALARWSLDELAILIGPPVLICVTLFVLTIRAVTHDDNDRDRHE